MMERFWNKVALGRRDECWLWTASKNRDGYGTFGVSSRTTVLAHRFSWTQTFGAIPVGQYVLHRCDTPACVNPLHLFLGDQADNVADCERKGRRNQVRYKSLSADQRDEIKRLYRTGSYTLAELGRRFGVPYQTIRYHV